MSWLRLEDDMLDHEKWRRALREGGDAVLLVWYRLTSWCSRRLTDGRIPADTVAEVACLERSKSRARALQALIDAELCTRHVDGAIVISGYLDRNPSKADVLSERDRRAQAQRDYALRKRLTCQQPIRLPGPDPVALPLPDDVPSQSRPNPVPEESATHVGQVSTTLATYTDLRGYEPTEEDYAHALLAGLSREAFDRRLKGARNTRIGGERGVFSQREHVRETLVPLWRKWEERDRARAMRPGSPAQTTALRGGGVWYPPERGKTFAMRRMRFTAEEFDRHAQEYAASEDWHDRSRKDADERFMAGLRRKAHERDQREGAIAV